MGTEPRNVEFTKLSPTLDALPLHPSLNRSQQEPMNGAQGMPSVCVKPRDRRRVSDKSTGETHFMDAAAGEMMEGATKRGANMAHAICHHQANSQNSAVKQQLDAICQQLRDHYSVK